MTALRRPALSLLLLALTGAGGCLYIPTPMRPTAEGREVVIASEDSLQRLVGATQEELLLRFGEPDWAAKEGAVLVYAWRVLEGFLVVGGQGGAAAADVTSTQLVLAELDQSGRVARIERTSAKWFQTTYARVEEWMGGAREDAAEP